MPICDVVSENLQTALMSMYNVGSQDMGDITKGTGLDGESVNHPNLYAVKSREFEKAQTKEGSGEDVAMAEG